MTVSQSAEDSTSLSQIDINATIVLLLDESKNNMIIS